MVAVQNFAADVATVRGVIILPLNLVLISHIFYSHRIPLSLEGCYFLLLELTFPLLLVLGIF